jgi:hypothetical protein
VSIEPRAELEMLVESGVLYMSMFRDGAVVARASAVFSATAARFWRIRESAGRPFYVTSPDGSTWTTKVSMVTQVDVSSVIIDLAGGHYSPGPGSAQVVRYDRLNQ